MNTTQRKEHRRLLRLWATGRATQKQMLRCDELDRMNNTATEEFEYQGSDDDWSGYTSLTSEAKP